MKNIQSVHYQSYHSLQDTRPIINLSSLLFLAYQIEYLPFYSLYHSDQLVDCQSIAYLRHSLNSKYKSIIFLRSFSL